MARKLALTDEDMEAFRAKKKKARKVPRAKGPVKKAAKGKAADPSLKQCMADKFKLEEKYMILHANYESQKEELEYISQEDEKKGALIEKYSNRLEIFQNDFENYKKRVKREKEEALEYAVEGVSKDMLEVVDNFERALGSDSSGDEEHRSGMAKIHRQLVDILAAHGVEKMNCQGEQFDPVHHEAVSQFKDESVTDGTIKEVQRPGYQLKEKVLRPARVIVATGGPEPPPKKKKKEPAKGKGKAKKGKGGDKNGGEPEGEDKGGEDDTGGNETGSKGKKKGGKEK